MFQTSFLQVSDAWNQKHPLVSIRLPQSYPVATPTSVGHSEWNLNQPSWEEGRGVLVRRSRKDHQRG